MSMQLTLYPQNYEGYSSTFSASSNEVIVDGINFTSINTSASCDSSTSGANLVALECINAENVSSGIIVNTWYRFRSTWGATPTLPTTVSNNLVLYSAAPASVCGVYQRLSGLTVGANYSITVNVTSIPATASVKIYLYDGIAPSQVTFLASSTHLAPSTSLTMSFAASSPENVIAIWLEDTAGSSMTVQDISMIPGVISPSGVYTDLIDGQVICDLYEEEDIPLTLSIDDFKNVAEQVKSYSKDFNLPATKRNNQIFNNMFEITRADDKLIFNPYVKTRCVLKQDGFILFEGYLRMIDIKDKEGEISYNVNLYSEVIALADILKDKTFSELDFDELDHEYNKQEIKKSWNESPDASITYQNAGTSGFRETYDTLRYPFIDWNHQWKYAEAGGTPTAGNPQLSTLETAFRPCIQLKYLINRIFADAGFNWTSDFFDSADFGKLYMDFNWGSDNNPVQSASSTTNTFFSSNGSATLAGTSYTNLSLEVFLLVGFPVGEIPPNYDSTTDILTSTSVNETYNIGYSYRIKNTDSVDRTIECRYLKNSTEFNYSGIITLAAGTSYIYQGRLNISLDTGDTLQAQFKASSAGVMEQAIDGFSGFSFGTNVVFILGVTNITTDTILQTLRGKLGQWDFLKGIMTMFNLVSLVDETDPKNLLIEPYGDIFINNTNSGNTSNLTLAARSIQHDWTDKVDVSQMELNPLTDLNKETVFKFVEDDDDYAFNVFKQAQSGHLYGSLKWDASGFTILEGTEEIIAEPFAATVSMPLAEPFANFIVPHLYAKNDDGTWEGFDNSPRIFYNNGIKDTGASYYIPEQNGLSSENQTEFLQFSHFSSLPPGVIGGARRDFVFTSSQLPTAVGEPPVDNLYNTYWSPYFDELYNADTRIMTLKVNLTPSDISTFKFYDTVMIKNRSFRVNKIEYKPNSLAKVEFILIP